jgi:hypothetical protein
MTIPWAKNTAFVGESFVIFLFWISCWSLIELTTEKFITVYWKKMLVFTFTLIGSILIMLIFADKFYKNI